MNKNTRFAMEQYGRRPVFSSFLPGIAGAKGIPAWCYYNNRGQAVCSFGVGDKDHSIMEFSPAHVAYQNVGRTGFRTFLRVDGSPAQEPFADGTGRMTIFPNTLELSWENSSFRVEVCYFTLPEAPVGGLCRGVRLTNLGPGAEFDLLDGMPAVVPYGVDQDMLKNMTQLAKAWMQVEDVGEGLPFYRVRASMADTAVVTQVQGGNFALGMNEEGTRLVPVVDPAAVFGYDTGLARPEGFFGDRFEQLAAAQTMQNLFPCAFFRQRKWLEKGGQLELLELYGQSPSKDRFRAFAGACRMDSRWFAAAQQRAEALTDSLCGVMETHTADPIFDGYCAMTYLDNLLRGGEPVRFAQGTASNVFYLYSRKHGDPEREYNYFQMLPEYYSQGNGNFRDMNQNRRCDVLFHPWVGDTDIRQFFSLLQSDGYNPLVVEQMTFTCSDPQAAAACVAEPDRPEALALLQSEFTPGQLAMAAEDWQFDSGDRDTFVQCVLAHGQCVPNASFKEGYWTDHWTYDLDLIESYLAVWPERTETLFYETRLPWFETPALVLPRAERYTETGQGRRATRFLDLERKAGRRHRWMREQHGAGAAARSSLMEKLLLLCAIKYATLDPAGIGIEMEGGKPGWYDALNGLPALSGSSVAESCELARLLAFAADRLEQDGRPVALYSEMADLLRQLAALPDSLSPAAQWDAANTLKERYRAETADGVQGGRTTIPARELVTALRRFQVRVCAGLKRAVALGDGICPTYLMFPEGPSGKPQILPLFLEGPVRWFKLDAGLEEKRAMAERVQNSGLYDRKLRMFKVNESLEHLTYEAGRCKAFTPGWLENESVWLHMEYKYLLELLKSGLYPEFIEAFRYAAVPFLKPEAYGRSTLENVSFLASSANPDATVHGRGFVARLSGSTAEFLQIWQLMFFGPAPFRFSQGELTLELRPMLPEYLIPKDGLVTARFLGQCDVTYHIGAGTAVIPGSYQIEGYTLAWPDGTIRTVEGDCLPDGLARAVRCGEVVHMDVIIGR